MIKNITVVGAGAWGTALAQVASLDGGNVTLLARDAAQVETINKHHENKAYLPGRALAQNIQAQLGFDSLYGPDLVLMVAPAQKTREVLRKIGADALKNIPVVLCAKGLEAGTLARQSEILREMAPDAIPFVLSGPSFADDMVAGRPTAVTLAGCDQKMGDEIAQKLSGPSFRLYGSPDVVGVELAGALKNIYALACGAVEGAGLGMSARAALIARGFAEMSRLVAAMGGDVSTLAGLAGLGDLTLSCTSEQSRNYQFGLRLGAGETVEQIKASGAKLAEGVMSAPVGHAMAQKHGVDTPLIDAVNLLLVGEVRIETILAGLMSRPLKREGNA